MNIENILALLPESWIPTNLGNLLSELTDYTANGSFASLKENVTYYSEQEYAVLVRTTDLKKKIFKPERFTDKKGYEFLSKSTLFGEEILMANVGSIGEVYLVPEYKKAMTLAPNMYLIKYKPNELDNMYAFHFMNSNIFLKQLFSKIASTTLKSINKNSFRAIKIPLPPLKEQEKIANIFSTADDKIDAIATHLEKIETLKKGLLQKLLSEGIGHSEFKETLLGRIPESWEVNKLKTCSELIKDGTHGTHKDIENGIPLLSAKDIQNGKVILDIDSRKISIEDFNKIHKSYSLTNNDLLLTVVGTLGRVALVEDYNNNYTFQRSVAIIRLIDINYPKYFYYIFNSVSFQKQLVLHSNASAQAGAYLGELEKLNIPLPPLKEQKQIANILSTADEKLEVLRSKKQMYKTLKKGLLQKLLSGKIRV